MLISVVRKAIARSKTIARIEILVAGIAEKLETFERKIMTKFEEMSVAQADLATTVEALTVLADKQSVDIGYVIKLIENGKKGLNEEEADKALAALRSTQAMATALLVKAAENEAAIDSSQPETPPVPPVPPTDPGNPGGVTL